jgi:hypothetical protein
MFMPGSLVGRTSEPHLHFQLQDGPLFEKSDDVLTASRRAAGASDADQER